MSSLGRFLADLFGIRPHRYFGRRLSHHHTSFGLIVVMLGLLMPCLGLSRGATAGTLTASGDVQVSAVVPGPPPSFRPTITQPSPGILHQRDITVAGTCGPNLLVRVFSNNIFIGETTCSSAGQFTVPVTIFTGLNDLVAINYDALDQAGPLSATVSVTFIPLSSQPSSTTNLLLEADYHLRQINVGEGATWHFSVSLGQAPYGVLVDWGDGQNQTSSVPKDGDFALSHSYTRAGLYKIRVVVSDQNGARTALQLVVNVSGLVTKPAGLVNNLSNCDLDSGLELIGCSWQERFGIFGVGLYWLALLLMILLWLLSIYDHYLARERARLAPDSLLEQPIRIT